MKKIIVISVILVISTLIFFCFMKLYMSSKGIDFNANTIEVVDKIKNYNYQLEDRDTDLYKEKFLKLKENLESENIDYKEYAQSIAELLVIDLYTIDNKINKYDIDFLEFIVPEKREDFKNKLIDTMYKLVEDNSNHTRKQELPVVNKVEVLKVREITYQKDKNKLPGYEVSVSLDYEKDLGYDKKVTLTLVREDNNIYVVTILADKI